jgi:PRC-barrel domain
MKTQRASVSLAVVVGLGLGIGIVLAAPALATAPFAVAQAMVPQTGMGDADKPMPMPERMLRRYPQPVRVGDLIGLRVLDDNDSTIGFVRQVVRTPQDKIALIVAYDGWFGWGARPVAVPIEVVGILGRQIASLDMARSEYAAAPTWQAAGAKVLGDDESIRIALARR